MTGSGTQLAELIEQRGGLRQRGADALIRQLTVCA